jgi:hypothetical protein
MRSDMTKVWREPGRAGRRSRGEGNLLRPRYGRKTGDPDDPKFAEQRTKQSMFPKHGRWTERKDERTSRAAFEKFLRQNVGRPWDHVYSEICEHTKDAQGLLFRQQMLEWCVDQTVRYNEEGELVSSHGYRVNLSGYFYVDPKGFLRYGGDRPAYKTTPRESRIFKIKRQEYVRYDDVWYRVTMRKPAESNDPVLTRNGHKYISDTDCFVGTVSGYGYYATEKLVRLYGEARVCKWKQQANSRECAKLKKLYAARFPE